MRIFPFFGRSGLSPRLVLASALAALAVTAGASAPAMAQFADSDGDGVADHEDLCTGTPSGRDPVLFGCAPVEALVHLELSLDHSARGLARTTSMLRDVEGLEREADRIDRLVAKLYDKTREQLDAARFCKAAAMAGRLSLKLEKSRTTLARRVEALGRAERRAPFEFAEPTDADATPSDQRRLDLEVARNLFASSVEDFADELGNIAPMCSRISGELSTRGRVVRIDDSSRQVELDSGIVLLLGNRAAAGEIYEGADIEAKGTYWGDGTGAATSVIVPGPIAKPGTFAIECMGMRVLPAQPLPPYSSGPFVMHSPEGYRAPSLAKQPILLELGMGIAMVNASGCNLPDAPAGTWTRVSARIDRLRDGLSDVVLAADLTEEDPPVRLPNYMTGIRITVRRQLCQDPVPGQPLSCQPPVDVRKQVYDVRLGSFYQPCEAVTYDKPVYRVDDSIPGDFDLARVTDVKLVDEELGASRILGGEVQDWAFSAEGYAAGMGVSSWPVSEEIGLDEGFAIQNYPREFYDVSAMFPFLEEELHGVDRPSGLRWPGVEGTRTTGHPFRYSCPLPTVGRDLIALCSGVADTYYRFPFEGGAPDWRLGQGNNGPFSHMGVFAFDFVAASGTPVLAPRGGTVIAVGDTNTGSCYCAPPACDPGVCQDCEAPNDSNVVAVLHDDGTLGRFFHFLPGDGVAVSEGQRVRRGDLLGKVGNTGCSTTEHVHFEVGQAPGLPSMEITFEADVPGSTTCYLPNTGDPVDSTNVQNP